VPTTDEQFRRTLDSLREGFQIIGFDWRYIYLNPAAASHGRSTPEALIGRVMWEAYPGIDRTPVFAVMKECMVERNRRVFENYFTFPDGSGRWFEIRVQAVPEGICVYSADIHDRKMTSLAPDAERQPHFLSRLWRGWRVL
jgi:PAS domain S-box-containing protein